MDKKEQIILGKTWEEWERECPAVKDMLNLRETVWINPDRIPCGEAVKSCSLTMEDVLDASRRLERFAPYFEKAFPETAATHGIIESPLKRIPEMKKALEAWGQTEISGDLWAKLDSHLAVSGSIKARGGIYEVLKHAEDIALEQGLLRGGQWIMCLGFGAGLTWGGALFQWQDKEEK